MWSEIEITLSKYYWFIHVAVEGKVCKFQARVWIDSNLKVCINKDSWSRNSKHELVKLQSRNSERNSDGILPLPKMHGDCECEVKPWLTKTISRWLKTTLDGRLSQKIGAKRRIDGFHSKSFSFYARFLLSSIILVSKPILWCRLALCKGRGNLV